MERFEIRVMIGKNCPSSVGFKSSPGTPAAASGAGLGCTAPYEIRVRAIVWKDSRLQVFDTGWSARRKQHGPLVAVIRVTEQVRVHVDRVYGIDPWK